MRQIKFRAWDKDSKRVHYAEDLIGPGGWVMQLHGVPLEIGIHSVFERENVKLMQYTRFANSHQCGVLESSCSEANR